jgi:chemotaxis receptor (MCP) glutamine deamidase CheD
MRSLRNQSPQSVPAVPRVVHPTCDNCLHLQIGDVATSKDLCIMDALLGSCVAVCLYDPILRCGGMNHILLPGTCPDNLNTRFGVHAMELLVNELMKQGGDRKRFVAKAFGGANVIPGMKSPTIGEFNAQFVRKFLAVERIRLIAEKLGGNSAIHVHFRTDSGQALLQSANGSRLPALFHEEGTYWNMHLGELCADGGITIF